MGRPKAPSEQKCALALHPLKGRGVSLALGGNGDIRPYEAACEPNPRIYPLLSRT